MSYAKCNDVRDVPFGGVECQSEDCAMKEASAKGNNKPVIFTDAELALIDQGLEALERGEGMTLEEAMELARKRTKAWMSTKPDSLSA